MIRYTIKLIKDEVEKLNSIIDKGSHSSQTFRVAYILLNCDEGKYAHKVTNEQISKLLKVSMRTIERMKKRFVKVTQSKKKKDWAEFMKWIADKQYPKAKRITIVMDNYNTQVASAFYESFEPQEAKRLWGGMLTVLLHFILLQYYFFAIFMQ